jgi:hypothetical protein
MSARARISMLSPRRYASIDTSSAADPGAAYAAASKAAAMEEVRHCIEEVRHCIDGLRHYSTISKLSQRARPA